MTIEHERNGHVTSMGGTGDDQARMFVAILTEDTFTESAQNQKVARQANSQPRFIT